MKRSHKDTNKQTVLTRMPLKDLQRYCAAHLSDASAFAILDARFKATLHKLEQYASTPETKEQLAQYIGHILSQPYTSLDFATMKGIYTQQSSSRNDQPIPFDETEEESLDKSISDFLTFIRFSNNVERQKKLEAFIQRMRATNHKSAKNRKRSNNRHAHTTGKATDFQRGMDVYLELTSLFPHEK